MNEAELNDLFASCLPKLKKAARRMLCNQQDSEDALQEGLLLAFRKLHQFEGRSSFATWLHSIVRNASRMQYRKVTAHPAVPIESEETPVLHKTEFVETGPSPEEICIQKERSEIIRKATTRMPARYQPAIQYFHLEGLSEQETAQKLCLTSSALKSQLHRSRRLLTSRIRTSYGLARRKRASLCSQLPGGCCIGSAVRAHPDC